MPKVYNRHHGDAPPDAVYCGRGTPWGNRFAIGIDGDRDDVCNSYESEAEADPAFKARVRAELRGKDLVCSCAPLRCHCDYLLRIANEETSRGTSMLYIVGNLNEKATAFLKEALDNNKIEHRFSSFINATALNKTFIVQEIMELRPTAVVCLGTRTLGLFTELKEDSLSWARNATFRLGSYPLYCTYSPTFFEHRGGVRANEYLLFCNDLRVAYESNRADYKEKTVPVQMFTQDDYVEFIKLFAKSVGAISLDYEGNSLETLKYDYRLGGVGLSDGANSAYLLVRSYENPGGELRPDVRDKLGRFLALLDARNTLLTFNHNYEYLVSLNVFGIRLERSRDVMQMLTSLDLRGGLKELAQVHLGIRGWTDDIDQWLENAKTILSVFKPTNIKGSKRDKQEWLKLEKEGLEAAIGLIKAKDLVSTPKVTKAFELLLSRSEECHGSRGEALRLMEQWLKYKHDSDDWEVRYTDIPAKFISQYCGVDCANTLGLYAKFLPEVEKKKLERASDYYNDQMMFGIQAELTGFKWDDDRAEELKQQYTKDAVEYLRRFLLLPYVKAGLEINPNQEIEILSATGMEVLKKYFNPDSTQPAVTATLSRLLVTDRVKLAMMLQDVNVAVQNRPEAATEYPLLYGKLVKLYQQKKMTPELATEAIKKAHQGQLLTLSELGKLGQYSRFSLPSAAAEDIESLADACKRYLGVDINAEDTWTDDYRGVFYYKVFKKISKAISAFIDGRNGRGMVNVVRDDGKSYMTRVSEYRPLTEEDRASGLSHLYAPHYGVNSAVTRRWTSAYHGIPGNSDALEALGPYGDDWLIGKCDYSQIELRVFAALAKEESMLRAFRDGKDIHRFFASNIFGKPEEEVNDAERGWSKKGTFGLLYGKSMAAFADEYMNGDLPATEAFFAKIFAMFPRMKAYIEEQKDKLFNDGSVQTIWGDAIRIQFDASKPSLVNEAIRFAVNYPIQASASNTTALTGYRLNNLARENGYRFKIPGFIHDCLQPVFPISETFIIFDKVIEFSEQMPWEEFQIPIKMDMEIGADLGSLVEFKRLKGESKFIVDGEIRAKFSGKKEAVDKLVGRLAGAYDVAVSDVAEEQVFNNWSDLYLKTNSGYKQSMGKYSTVVGGSITISRRNS